MVVLLAVLNVPLVPFQMLAQVDDITEEKNQIIAQLDQEVMLLLGAALVSS